MRARGSTEPRRRDPGGTDAPGCIPTVRGRAGAYSGPCQGKPGRRRQSHAGEHTLARQGFGRRQPRLQPREGTHGAPIRVRGSSDVQEHIRRQCRDTRPVRPFRQSRPAGENHADKGEKGRAAGCIYPGNQVARGEHPGQRRRRGVLCRRHVVSGGGKRDRELSTISHTRAVRPYSSRLSPRLRAGHGGLGPA